MVSDARLLNFLDDHYQCLGQSNTLIEGWYFPKKRSSIREALFDIVKQKQKESKEAILKNNTVKNHNSKVFIIQPLPHGNGGWCGSTTLQSQIKLKDALQINPYTKYDLYYDAYNDGCPRICYQEDVNKSLYYFDYEEKIWKLT